MKVRLLAVAVILALPWVVALADLPRPENPRWTPQPDDVYLQEIARHVRTDRPLSAVAVFRGQAYVGDAHGVRRLDGDVLAPAGGPATLVHRLRVIHGVLWAATGRGLWGHDGRTWRRIGDIPVADMCGHRGDAIVASGAALYRVDGDSLVEVARGRAPVEGVASYSENLHVRHARRIGVVARGRYNYADLADWGTLQPGCTTRDLLAVGSRLWVATDRGLGVLRGMTWYRLRGEDGLCYEDTTCVAPGFARDVWIGTTRGAIRHVNGTFQYFGYQRWVPHDRVNAIAAGDRIVYIATDGGLGIIEYEPYTLRKKAAWYERWMEEWGVKRLGFTHKLFRRGDEFVREVSDNDVGYSSHYFAARCFEYAVTGDRVVRAEAVDMMKSVKWSEEISSIDGYPARSIWAVGEKGAKAAHGSGGLPAEWHRTPDGKWEWKGDTSSDETDAHNYVVSLFLELVAEGDERDMAIEHLHRVVGHIVDNGWVLRDVDDKPTRWARWDPEYLQRPYGFYARGLNGMEALSYVTTAYHFTRDEKFRRGKRQLIDWGYPREVLRQKMTFPPDDFTHFDDRLAFYAYSPLLRYETDPELRSMWLRSFERSWEVKRIEGVPWYSFIYAAITGHDCESDRAVAHLREWPLDLVFHSVINSHRDDLHAPRGYRVYADRVKPLSPREAGPRRVSADWMRLDYDARGGFVSDPSWWLETYWMGRYFGLIEAPTVTDAALLTVPARGLSLGAEPYRGPDRPELPLTK